MPGRTPSAEGKAWPRRDTVGSVARAVSASVATLPARLAAAAAIFIAASSIVSAEEPETPRDPDPPVFEMSGSADADTETEGEADDDQSPTPTQGDRRNASQPDSRDPTIWARPPGATRTPSFFDFEDRITDDGIIVPFPIGWLSGNPGPPNDARPGFPFWNEPGYSDRFAWSGEYSFRLPTRGGSTAALTEPGAFPAMPGSEYVVAAKLRTEGLRHARVRMIARFLTIDRDAAGSDSRERGRYVVVPGSERASTPKTSEGGWTSLRLDMPGDERADFIQVELQLLQPTQRTAGSRRPHEALHEDVDGAAYFDDVAIYQVPKLSIATADPSNIIEAPDHVELLLNVSDLTGEPLTARVWVWDMNGAMVDDAVITSAHSAGETIWRPDLPAYGWYRATIGVRNASAIVGVGSVDFLYLAPRGERGAWNAARFGVIAEELEVGELRRLPGVIDKLGAGAVSLSAWGALSDSGEMLDAFAAAGRFADGVDSNHSDRDDDDNDGASALVAAFDQAVDTLLEERRDLTFVLAKAPERLAREWRVDQHDPLAMLALSDDAWLGSIDGLLTRYGERVARWQIGASGSSLGFGRPDLESVVLRAQRAMRRLVPGVSVLLPWDAEQSVDQIVEWARGDALASVGGGATPDGSPGVGVGGVLMRFGDGMPSMAIPHYVRSWPRGVDVALFLESPDEEIYGRRAAAIDLAKRAVLAWEAGVDRLMIRSPWRWRADERGGAMRPTVAAVVWRELAAALADSTPGGRLPAADGVTLVLGDAGDSGTLIGWADYATGPDAELRAFLGDGRVLVRDIFGNASPARIEGGQHVIQLGETPVFIEGVDPDLLRFWAAIRFEPATIPSRAQRHDLELVLENPWPVTISGTLRFADPESWRFEPRVVNFSLRRGETGRIPVSVTLNVGEESGRRTIDTELLVKADRMRVGPLRVPVLTELGLRDVEMSGSYRVATGPTGERDRVIVVVLATNHGEAPLSLEAFAQAPGFRTEQAPIVAIEPGDSRSATFIFDDPDQRLMNGRIRVGVREQRNNGRLNKTLHITGQ